MVKLIDKVIMVIDYKAEIQKIKDLPTIPETFNRITRLLLDENSSIIELTKEISMDQALTAKILKIVNSAYYGFYRKISDLNDAVALLGFNEVKLMVMGVSVFEPFSSSIKDPKERYHFWEHSMLCSITAENIGEQIKCEAKDLSVAGLLHDIGKVVLDRYFHDEWCKYLDKQAGDSRPNMEVEQECLGVTHAEIGYLVAERWNLPPNLVECIKLHHDPDPESLYYNQICVISLANVLCKSIASETRPTENLEIPKDLIKVLNLDNSTLTAVLTNVIPRLKGIKALLGTYIVPESE